jgi:ApaG protein
MGKVPFFYRMTGDIRIRVHPLFLDQQSRPAEGRFVFAYVVRIENVGRESAHLLRRRWLIHDGIGEDTEVEGDGVVGQQPVIPAGGVHEYQSYCVLKSTSGHMEGAYTFARPDGTTFEAMIPRFTLSAVGASDPH